MEKSAVKRKLSTGQLLAVSDLPSCSGKIGAEYLVSVSDWMSTHRHKRFVLQNPVGATLRVGHLEDTIYSEKDDEVNGWGKFYLPDIVNMQVVGVAEGTSCPCDQLVLMTCEDKNIYAYDGEELHLVASSLHQLRSDGIDFPSSKPFYKGEAFKDMTEEDWAEVRKGPVGRKLDQEHQKWVKAKKSRLLQNLLLGEEKRRLHQLRRGDPLDDNMLSTLQSTHQSAHTEYMLTPQRKLPDSSLNPGAVIQQHQLLQNCAARWTGPCRDLSRGKCSKLKGGTWNVPHNITTRVKVSQNSPVLRSGKKIWWRYQKKTR